LSGKRLVRETTCPGNVLSGKRLSGKLIVRETSVKRIDASTYVVMRRGLIISGQSNLTTGRIAIATAHGRLNGIRQVALVCTST